jgi:T5SS/PEP-CTERM-associated repeat protein
MPHENHLKHKTILLLVQTIMIASILSMASFAQSPFNCLSGKGGSQGGQTWSGTYEGDASAVFLFRISEIVGESVNGTCFMDSTNFEGVPGRRTFGAAFSSLAGDAFSISSTTEEDTRNYRTEFSGNLDFNNCEASGTWTITFNYDTENPELFTGTWTASGSVVGGGSEGEGEGEVEGEGEGEATEYFWSTNNGNYDGASNWEPARVPGSSHTATFDRLSTYAVTVGANRILDRAQVESGTVTLANGSLTLNNSSLIDQSLHIGGTTTELATLTLRSLFLSTVHTRIAFGECFVDDSSAWGISGRLTLGGGAATMNIDNNGIVTAGELRVGDGAGDFGVLTMAGGAFLQTGSLAAGLAGSGSIEFDDAALISELSEIGSETGSTGNVSIGDGGTWTLHDILTVGKNGTGTLQLSDGAELEGIRLNIALGSNASGEVTVDNASLKVDTAQIGLRGVAMLHISGGSFFIADTVDVGRLGATRPQDAKVVVDDASLAIDRELFVGSIDGDENVITAGHVRIQNNGTIGNVLGTADIRVYPGSILTVDGTIAGNVHNEGGSVVVDLVSISKSNVTKQLGATMVVDGNLTANGGVIAVTVGGLNTGEFGIIDVAGNLDISDATIQFNFIDKFLPETGDVIPFLEVEGTSTVANLSLEYTGVRDGFDYEVVEEDGMLVFEALNDAESEGGGEGEGEGEGESPTTGCGAVIGNGISHNVMGDLAIVALALLVLLATRKSRKGLHPKT